MWSDEKRNVWINTYMKRNVALVLLMALFPLQSLWAQHYSVEELIRGFYAQYVEKSSEGRLEMEGLDMLMYAHEDIGRIRQSPDKPFLCFNEELHMAGDLKLPASVFVELYEGPGWESHLYWYSLRDSSCVGESDRLRVTLQRKYGSKQLPGGAVLVPAKWFSGELHELRNPFVYGNVPVSGSRRLYRIEKGVYAKFENGNDYISDRDFPELEIDARNIARTTTGRNHEAGPEDAKLSNYRAMELFSREFSRHLDLHLLPEDMERTYSIMLHLDDYDRIHLYPLLPRELTIEDKLILTILGNVTEQQPAHTFSKLRSPRGTYPAVFLKVHLKRRRCFFSDYKYLE